MSTSTILKSFIGGGVVAAILVAIGFFTGNVLIFSLIAAACFTHISCLMLDNNIIPTMITEICGWSFMKFVEWVFSDFGGINVVLLISVQIILIILGLLVSIIIDLFAVALSVVLSVVIYPYALIKAIFTKKEA